MINLEKGQKVDLTKGSSASNFYIGLGWDQVHNQGADDVDVDVSALICKANASGDPKLLSDKHFVFYSNLSAPDGSIVHQGDNLTGEGDGDDEVMIVDMTKIDPSADEISIVSTIHNANALGQNFGAVRNAYIRICEANGNNPGKELMKFDLSEDYSVFTAIQFGSIYKKDGEWRFDAVGQGFKAELGALLSNYQ